MIFSLIHAKGQIGVRKNGCACLARLFLDIRDKHVIGGDVVLLSFLLRIHEWGFIENGRDFSLKESRTSITTVLGFFAERFKEIFQNHIFRREAMIQILQKRWSIPVPDPIPMTQVSVVSEIYFHDSRDVALNQFYVHSDPPSAPSRSSLALMETHSDGDSL
jgi:hypothetical protein